MGVGGSFASAGRAAARTRIAALSLATGQALPWDVGLDDTCCASPVLRVDGTTLYVAGSFRRIRGVARTGLAAVDVASGRLLDWNPQLPADWCKFGSCPVAPAAGRVYVAGDFSPRLVALGAADGRVLDWNPRPDDDVGAIAATAGAVYVAGDFEEVGGAERAGLAALDPTTGAALPWRPQLDADGDVASIAVVGSTVYLAGDFSRVDGVARNGFAAVDAATGRLLPWDPRVGMDDPDNDSAGTLVVPSGDRVYIGGRFERASGLARPGLAAVDTAAGDLTSWAPDVSGRGSVRAIGPVGDRVYVGGYFPERLVVVPAAR
jgi:hypothetical protein